MQPALLEVLVIVAGVFLRRAGIPAAVVFLPLDTGLVQVLVVQAAIASAVSSTNLTRLHHGEIPTALRGLRYHLEDRVFVHGNRTVVFRD